MTPQEKSKELYDKMYRNCTMTIAGAGSIWKPLVKKQCLIAVDEVMYGIKTQIVSPKAIYYWKSVKEEINKL